MLVFPKAPPLSSVEVSMQWISFEFAASLPGDRAADFQVSLPCPGKLMLSLLAAAGDRRLTAKLVRTNPSLLTTALALHFFECGAAPDSAAAFQDWCSVQLVPSLRRVSLTSKPASAPKAVGKEPSLELQWEVIPRAGKPLGRKRKREFWEDFCRARSCNKLRKSLLAWWLGNSSARFSIQGLESAVDPVSVSKVNLKKVVELQLGNWLGMLRGDGFGVARLQRRATAKRLQQNWKRASTQDVDVEEIAELVNLVGSGLESARTFDQRLLQEKLASMKQLAYGASHEINNPLANIATRAQTLLAIESDHDKRFKLSVIYEQAIRAHEMISDMMLFAHPPGLSRQLVSPRLLLAKLYRELESLVAPTTDISLSITIGCAVSEVELDPTQVTVALKNLIQNSLESLRGRVGSDKRIEVRVDEGDNRIEFSVWDNGEPIPRQVARHLFDPFYSGREAGRGLGFGLCKVWTIAQLHEGEVCYDRSAEVGTRFTLSIPRRQATALASSTATGRDDAELVIGSTPVVAGEEAA